MISVDDQSIIGACGEAKLENEQGSWRTIIQVRTLDNNLVISLTRHARSTNTTFSHGLPKSFESLFGSVTCLPGCFTLYRI
ncbi:glycosyltransferase family 2 protein [Athelia psychrophila]|uniref:Glycosyltransferase family 2 protein n=1 Tax=Athelia psychrophila TaxID=1759441 RepID=A0A166IJA6_9AGAM|nr:glycosyltransferase family 2 protein [Fibularhizoctonia sp. CBS 109695]